MPELDACKRLAAAVLMRARDDGALAWIESDACLFWCELLETPHVSAYAIQRRLATVTRTARAGGHPPTWPRSARRPTERQLHAYALRQQGLTLREIAERLDYRNPEGARYAVRVVLRWQATEAAD